MQHRLDHVELRPGVEPLLLIPDDVRGKTFPLRSPPNKYFKHTYCPPGGEGRSRPSSA